MPTASFRIFGGVAPARAGAALGVFAAALLFTAGLFAASPAAAFSETYAFADLEWGSTPEAAAQLLEAQGFKIEGAVSGPRREFVEQNAWGAFEDRDRGKRLIARGLVAGQRVTVDLVFGYNAQLERVILGAPNWDGTRDGARRMTNFANTLTRQLEERYGRSYDKRTPFGFIDTARWMPAQDGSRLELYVRGTNGYMFFPQDTTSLRVHIWNDSYRVARPDTMLAGDGKIPGTQATRESTRDSTDAAARAIRARRARRAADTLRPTAAARAIPVE